MTFVGPTRAKGLTLLFKGATSLAATVTEKTMEESAYTEEYKKAADSALKAIEWDGFDPRPVAGVMLELAGRLEAAGHTTEDVSRMLSNLAEIGQSG